MRKERWVNLQDSEREHEAQAGFRGAWHVQSPYHELREQPKAEVVENGPYRIYHVGV